MYTKKRYPRLYNTWRAMKGRCNNSNQLDYKYYGAKGVVVCKEWESFIGFATYAFASGYIEGQTIDRVDTNKNYTPSNCQWLSHSDNVIKGNKNRYKDRYDTAYLYWLSIEGGITGTKLGTMFGVSFSTGCMWVKKFKKEINGNNKR
jgi:hypothetical protein